LKKIGFTNPDGTPSSIYKSFRNSATRGSAAAASLKFGYAPLYVRNEYMHQLSDEKLKGLIIEETGQSEDSSVAGLVLASIKAIKKYADFSSPSTSEEVVESGTVPPSFGQEQQNLSGYPAIRSQSQSVGMNLAYTINLNLPATSDIAVFNAIFKSLRENLLQDGDA
jgi:predicted RND superfamily exporter protein